jgi:hypothetical protein
VRGHRQIEGLGEVADLHERGDAAAIGDVGLGEGHPAGHDQRAELVQRVEVLPRRDGHPALAHDADVARHVVRDRGLLEPDQVLIAERPRRADGLVDAPPHVGIRHQGDIRAEMRAHGTDPLDVLPKRGPAHLHLDGPEPAGQVVVGLAQQAVERQLEIDAAGIAGHARIESPQDAPERCPLPPRAQIPQRDIHRRDGESLGPAAAAVVQRPPHELPERLDVLGLAAGEPRGQIARQQRPYRGAAGAHRVGVAHALGAVGVAHARGDQLEALDDPVGRVGERDRQRDAIVIGLEVSDLHVVTGRGRRSQATAAR